MVFNSDAFLTIAIQLDFQIISILNENQIRFGNAFTKDDLVITSVFCNFIKTVSPVINISIIAAAAVEDIPTFATRDNIISFATFYGIITSSGIYDIIAIVGIDCIITSSGIYSIIINCRIDGFMQRSLVKSISCILQTQRAAIGKSYIFYAITIIIQGICDNQSLSVISFDINEQIIAFCTET